MKRGAAVVRYEGKRGVVYRIKYPDADGKQVMETLGREADGWNERKAKAELRERLVRVERRGYRRPKRTTFCEYAATWLSEGERRRAWKPRTVVAYRHVLDRLGENFGSMPLSTIRPRHVAEYVADAVENYGSATVNRDVSVLHDVFATAKREELVDSNPAERVERPKPSRRDWRILEPVEVARVAKAFVDDQARVAFLTLVLTGIRRSELRALRWRDVDLVDGVLRVRDSKSEEGVRSIALPPRLAEELWQHRRRSPFDGDDERVFYSPKTGGPYSVHRHVQDLRVALAVAGVDGHVRPFHDLRHTSITNDAAAGANPVALMAKAGHRSMKTTNVYVHLAGVVFRSEAEALERRLLGGETETEPVGRNSG